MRIWSKAPKLVACLVAVLVLFGISGARTALATDEERKLLLVTAGDLEIEPLSATEVRKLFLGIPVTKDGNRLNPVRNVSDPLLTQVFLQKVVFMSERTYERQLVTRVFRYGGTAPPAFSDLDDLIGALSEIPGSVTCLWSHQLPESPHVKSLGVVWSGSID